MTQILESEAREVNKRFEEMTLEELEIFRKKTARKAMFLSTVAFALSVLALIIQIVALLK